jgi:hypothetical protein
MLFHFVLAVFYYVNFISFSSVFSQANLEALKNYQILEQDENNDRTFISSDDNIQRKRTYKVQYLQ